MSDFIGINSNPCIAGINKGGSKMDDINCPYCDEEIQINHDDGQGYREDELHQQECDACGKIFVFTTSIHYYYDAKKADCLNGAEHKYQPTMTFPKEYTRMRCIFCDEERQPTQEEKIKFEIPDII